MPKTRVQPKDEEIGYRVRRQARQLSGRVAVFAGELCLVDRKPDFTKLCRSLVRLSSSGAYTQGLQINDLGFSSSDLVRISRNGLATRGRALQKWRKIIDDRDALRKQKTETRRKVEGWKLEVDSLSSQLEHLLRTLHSLESGKIVEMGSIILAPSEIPVWKEFLIRHRRILAQHDAWEWLARVVFWLNGPRAAEIFASTLTGYIEGERFVRIRDLVEKIDGRMKLIFDTFELKKPEIRLSKLISSVEKLLADLPADVEPPRRLDGSFSDATSRAREVSAIQFAHAEMPDIEVVACLASFCALNPATRDLPPRIIVWLNAAPKSSIREEWIAKVFKYSDSPCINQLLEFLDSAVLRQVAPDEIDPVRELLTIGVTVDDVNWLRDPAQRLLWQFAEKKISPAPIRGFLELLDVYDASLPEHVRNDFVEKLYETADLTGIEALNRWLALASDKALTPALLSSLRSMALLIANAGKFNPRFRQKLAEWAVGKAKAGLMPNPPDDLDPSTRAALDRLAFYQQMSGQTPAQTKSILSLVPSRDSVHEEAEYLRGLERTGALAADAKKRLSTLERAEFVLSDQTLRKLQRQIEKVCAVQALDALRHIVDDAWRSSWRETFDDEFDLSISQEDAIDILSWVRQLTKKPARSALEELLRFRRELKQDYKRGSRMNQDWIGRFERQGGNSQAWLFPPSDSLESYERQWTISVCHDPLLVFLMGSHFNTCLALGTGANRDAVLANAVDANKAVIYAMEGGKIVARKLVGLSQSLQLIGYRTYCSENANELIPESIERFCTRWARSAGVELGYFGQPENIHDLFWYDDGIQPWSPFVHDRGSEDETAGSERAGIRVNRALTPEVERHWQAIQNLLESIGLSNRTDMDPRSFAEREPAMAEEALGIICRQTPDMVLAEKVFSLSRSQGGRLEAITSLARLRGRDFYPEVARYGRQFPEVSCRLAKILADDGSEPACSELIKLVNSHSLSWLWLPFAASRSDTAAGIIPRLMVDSIDYREFDHAQFYWFGWMSLIAEQILGAPLSDALLGRALAAYSGQLGFWRDDCAIWPPKLKNPDRILNVKHFETLSAGLRFWCISESTKSELAVAALAIRNPCAAATKFLHDRAATIPIYLLALAMINPHKYRQFVEKAAPRHPSSPAAVLALATTHGFNCAREIFMGLGDSDPMRCAVEFVEKLHAETLNPTDSAVEKAGQEARLVCELLLTAKFWEHENKGSAEVLTLLNEHPSLPLRFPGALIKIAYIADRLSGEERGKLESALRSFKKGREPSAPYYSEPPVDLALLLLMATKTDFLESELQLWRLPQCEVGRDCQSDSIFCYLFFRDDLSARPIARFDWNSTFDVPAVPEEPELMDKTAAFYTATMQGTVSNKAPTAIMTALLQKHAADPDAAKAFLDQPRALS